jgi:hypothetical protein
VQILLLQHCLVRARNCCGVIYVKIFRETMQKQQFYLLQVTTVNSSSSYIMFAVLNAKKAMVGKKAIINRQSSSKWHFHVHCARNLPRLFLEFLLSRKVQINNSNMRDLNLKHHAPLCDGQNLCVSPLLELKKCFQNLWAENPADL